MTVQSITIDPAAIDPEDADMLQDMVCAAVNEVCALFPPRAPLALARPRAA